MTVYLKMGSAAEERIIRMEQAMISSRSVIPASREGRLGVIRLGTGLLDWIMRNIPASIPLRLDLQRRLAGDQRYQFLLRIFGVDLHDRQVRSARRECLHHDADQSTGPTYTRSV